MSVRVKQIYTENNDYQHIEVIKRNREKRNKYREFFVEGVKSIERAILNNWGITSFIFSSQRKLSNWAKEILANSKAKIHYDLSLELMNKLSDKEEQSELMALVTMPENSFSRIQTGLKMLVVVFDRPSNHGNLGTILRSCDSFKVNGLIITGHAVDVYDPQTVRSSMGSFFAVPTVCTEKAALLTWFNATKAINPDLQIIGTSAKATRVISEEDLTKPTILFLGNETEGLSKGYKEICDKLLTIPIYGSATSLNVACAASICLYEIDRQRRD